MTQQFREVIDIILYINFIRKKMTNFLKEKRKLEIGVEKKKKKKKCELASYEAFLTEVSGHRSEFLGPHSSYSSSSPHTSLYNPSTSPALSPPSAHPPCGMR